MKMYTVIKNPLIDGPILCSGWLLAGDVEAIVVKDPARPEPLFIDSIDYGDVHVYNSDGQALDTPITLRYALQAEYKREVERIVLERAEKARAWFDYDDV